MSLIYSAALVFETSNFRISLDKKSFEETAIAQRYQNNILTAFVQELQDDELQDEFFSYDVNSLMREW